MLNIEVINKIDSTIEINLKELSKLLEQTIKNFSSKTKEFEISLTISDNKFIAELNKQYRDKDQPTNVLSLPAYDFSEDLPPIDFIHLGDIIISEEKIIEEAKEQEKEPKDHFTHLLLHGILHLIGYEHEENNQAKEMEELEIKILSKLNINNPYH